MSAIRKISFKADDAFKWSVGGVASSKPQENNSDTKILKTAAYVSSAVAVTALGIAAVSLSRGRGMKDLKAMVSSSNAKLETVNTNLTNKINDVKADKLSTAIDTINAKLGELSSKVDKSINLNAATSDELRGAKKWYDGWIKALEDKVAAVKLINGRPPEKNLAVVDNIALLQNLDNDGKRIFLDENTIKWLKDAAPKYINGTETPPIRKLNRNSTIWSMTAESIPEKEGGLGEVPVQIAKNMTHELGIDNYIVRPMSLLEGKSNFIERNGKYTYTFDLDKPKHYVMDLDKVAEFETSTFRNGKYETQTVEVFTGIDPKFGYKRLMFKNSDYFKSKGLYTNSQKASEAERYAFFPKAVYDFQKFLLDPSSMPNIKVFGKIDEIKPPEAMILNDWHAAAMAALNRLKAPAEASAKELSKDAAETLKTMNMININHNLDYQGSSWQHQSDMLNTLFDKYAYDIYEYANTGFEGGIAKVMTIDGNANLANMGASLSNKMVPVSPTYARELAEQGERSMGLQHICKTRLAAGTLKGRSNGWDRSVNELSVSNVAGFSNMLNNDKFLILKDTLKKIAGLDYAQKNELNAILKKAFDVANFRVRIEELRKIGSQSINLALDELASKGILTLRELKPNTHADTTEHILLARRHNKRQFLNLINSMVEHEKVRGDKLFPVAMPHLTDFSHIRPEDLDETIVFNMGVRFTAQKGVDIAANSIKKVLNEWAVKYPNKPKPVFAVGGVDSDGGKVKQFIFDLKNALAENGKQIFHNDGYTSNPIWQAGSDFTLYSSHFEPDGAKWESLYKGTPVICTRVGGHVDSVADGVNGFLTKSTVPEIRQSGRDYMAAMSEEFADAIYRAVDTFYDREKYAQMVRKSIDGNQSWVIKDAEGKITGGVLSEYLKDLGFNLADFPQIKLAA